MHVDFTPEQRNLQQRLRSYFDELMSDERRKGLSAMNLEGGTLFRDTVKKMGRDGWLGVGWPKEYGGGGLTAIEQLIFFDELRRARAPLPFVTLNTVGPALMQHGSDEHKEQFLTKILAGEVHFAIGYTEPDAGTDLATLKTSAVKDGDDWIINGTKIFTSGANDADYVWLAARTDPDAPKHKGITIFIVPTDDPGFTHSLIHTVGGGATCMTYYENIRVPSSAIVGGLNGGWRMITTQLNHERVGLAAFGAIAYKHLEDVDTYARETKDADGEALIDKPRVQTALAECFARLEAMRVMNYRMAYAWEQGHMDPAHASAVKVYSTETVIQVYRRMAEVIGPAANLRAGSPGAAIAGAISQEARSCQINTFGGGVNEIQREIISMAGLSMPRVPR